jgi:hypothetical protein
VFLFLHNIVECLCRKIYGPICFAYREEELLLEKGRTCRSVFGVSLRTCSLQLIFILIVCLTNFYLFHQLLKIRWRIRLQTFHHSGKWFSGIQPLFDHARCILLIGSVKSSTVIYKMLRGSFQW